MLAAVMLAFICMPVFNGFIHRVNMLQTGNPVTLVNERRQCEEQIAIAATRLMSVLVFMQIFLR
jgi:hypothetical protein